MKRRSAVRLLAVGLLSAALSVALVGPVSAHSSHHRPLLNRIELPDGFQPEGIAIDKSGIAYFGSRVDGDIYAASLRTGKGAVISQGPGTPSLGLKIDNRKRLFVAGGPSGTGRVVDARTGDVLRSYTFTTAPSFVNDVVLTSSGAWFTDSLNAQLYRVPIGRHGRLGDFTTLPLTGDWQQVAGFAANGIAETPDHRALLVVQSNTGLLYRINKRTGDATQVDLGGHSLLNGDGLLVQGRILFAVQNQNNQVAVVKLNRRGTEGRFLQNLTSADFDVPTTIAAYQSSLYLPNARFRAAGQELPEPADYWVTRIDNPYHH